MAAITAPHAQARPSGPVLFCQTYPESPQCTGEFPTCGTCHLSTGPATWNAYGARVFAGLAGAQFDSGLVEAMRAVELEDSDGDGMSNLEEIQLGTNPGNPDSLWDPIPQPTGEANLQFNVGAYDARFALKRAMVLYCGASPNYHQSIQFAALAPEAQREALHEHVAACLDAPYWRQEGLARLADPRIRPLEAIGRESKVVIDGFIVALADYEWDYRLWQYIMSDDRDFRELMTAQYHVEAQANGDLAQVWGEIPDPIHEGLLAGGQPLAEQHRAGMITTQWFLMLNTMFSDLPRTTAAMAYRAYLGMDLSHHEGIVPVAGEPLDIDDKGVRTPDCAQCHSTLDPLAYAFAYYEGIVLPYGTGVYDENRPLDRIAGWDQASPRTVLLGQEVSSVVEWGRVAADSQFFRRKMVTMFMEHALGRAIQPDEQADLEYLMSTLADDGHSANRLIHRLVDTYSFGTP